MWICRDILAIARSLPALEALCVESSKEAGRVGLAISTDKTKYTRFSGFLSRRSLKAITINGVTYEGVAMFIYLGTLISIGHSVEKGTRKVFWPAIELILPL
jgi:methylmalonyl-CoA mutase N-terminal domain/subunit